MNIPLLGLAALFVLFAVIFGNGWWVALSVIAAVASLVVGTGDDAD